LEQKEPGFADNKVFLTKRSQNKLWEYVQIKILKIKDEDGGTHSKLMIQIRDVS
jgi:hypothetical protein